MIRHEIPAAIPDMPVERYVRRAWPMLPGRSVRDLFRRRDVKINGRRCTADEFVRAGDELLIYLPDSLLPAPAELVFADDRLLAACKPQGLPVDADRDGVGADTLLARLRADHPAARLCHRLDAATGGVVLAALDDETERQALETFKIHALRKRYLALARGGFERREDTLRAWLVKDARRSVVRVLHREASGARAIETRYRVLDERGGVARVELEPVTGRTHQLRAHMADFGHPLLGDDKYGDRAFNRQSSGAFCLWCAELTIANNAPLADYRGHRFAAPAPDWWEEKP